MAINKIMALILLLIMAFVGIVFVQKLRTKKNLRALAGRLGFSTTPDVRIPGIKRSCKTRIFDGLFNNGDLPNEVGITGQLRGKQVRFSVFTTPKARGNNYWMEMAVAVRANEFTFCIHQNNISANVTESRAGLRIKIGDEELDRRLRILTNDANKMKTLLKPGLRKEIDESLAYIAEFCLEFGWLRYREWGNFITYPNAKRIGRYESMLPLMSDLADAIEAIADKA